MLILKELPSAGLLGAPAAMHMPISTDCDRFLEAVGKEPAKEKAFLGGRLAMQWTPRDAIVGYEATCWT